MDQNEFSVERQRGGERVRERERRQSLFFYFCRASNEWIKNHSKSQTNNLTEARENTNKKIENCHRKCKASFHSRRTLDLHHLCVCVRGHSRARCISLTCSLCCALCCRFCCSCLRGACTRSPPTRRIHSILVQRRSSFIFILNGIEMRHLFIVKWVHACPVCLGDRRERMDCSTVCCSCYRF